MSQENKEKPNKDKRKDDSKEKKKNKILTSKTYNMY